METICERESVLAEYIGTQTLSKCPKIFGLTIPTVHESVQHHNFKVAYFMSKILYTLLQKPIMTGQRHYGLLVTTKVHVSASGHQKVWKPAYT